jgi:hypothetical protein
VSALRTYRFVFVHPLRAKKFVEKLVKEVRDVGAFRDGAEVRVFDVYGDKFEQIAPLTWDSLKKDW